MTNEITKTAEAIAKLGETFPIYQDLAQPAVQELGKGLHTVSKLIHVALAPVSLMVWGFDQIKDYTLDALEQKMKDVPAENIIAPDLSIAGPALENMRFLEHKEDLREMFTNLLAASINIEFTDKVHPSYVEIIKQLSSLDAQNLMTFKDKSVHPIAEYRIKHGVGYEKYLTNVFLANKQFIDLFLLSASISNLERLGLVSVNYNEGLHKSAYEQFFNTDIYKNYKLFITKIPHEGHGSTTLSDEKFVLQKGAVSLTEFGRNFIKVSL